jgi:phenylalanyl-tRNA synthetase beta chain
MDPGDPERLGLDTADRRYSSLEIENPLTAANSVMRTSLLPGALNVIRRNISSELDGLRIFELGKVFIPNTTGKGLPDEELHITALFTGNSRPLQWLEEARSFDFFDMKGELESLLRRLGIEPEKLEVIEPEKSFGGFIFQWLQEGEHIAEGGKLAREVCSRYEIDEDVYYFDVLIDNLEGMSSRSRYSDISPYPVVKRDLCLVAGDKVTFADITNLIKKRAKFLESIFLFDYYRGGHLGESERSYTFRLSFRSPKGTLDDDMVDAEIERILEGLKRELRVALRSD